MPAQNTQNRIRKTVIISGCGMLTAVAVVLQYLEIPIPIMPNFIKLDFSDLPELIGAFAYGPVAGLAIAFLKNLIHMGVSQSGFVGELSNFLLGGIFSAAAGWIYQIRHTKRGALLAGCLGAIGMAAASFPLNLFVIYPLYYEVVGLPESGILALYQALIPGVSSISEALLLFNVPFTLAKGLLCMGISLLLYKPLSGLLHHR